MTVFALQVKNPNDPIIDGQLSLIANCQNDFHVDQTGVKKL